MTIGQERLSWFKYFKAREKRVEGKRKTGNTRMAKE